MRPRSLFIALGLVAALGLAAAPAAAVPAPRTADVHGDDERDEYVGTGGLILPGSVPEPTRREVAGCPGCHWRLTSPCVEAEAGVPFDGNSACTSVVRGCPQGARLLRAWFEPAGGPWREIGLVCLAVGDPPTVATTGAAARDRFAEAVPPASGRSQPSTGVVAQLPVVFSSGQAGADRAARYVVAGQEVVLQAAPRWHWEFGDGATLTTDEPGGRYPVMTVSHTYRHAGRYPVRLTTTWSARFTVDGLGPFPVDEPIVQTDEIDVSVGEGRAVLAVR